MSITSLPVEMSLHLGVFPRCQNLALQLRRTLHPGYRTFFKLPHFESFIPSPGSGRENGSEQTYHTRKILPYTQQQLYELVADVDNYRCFLPYCTESKVLRSWLASSPAGNANKMEKKEARLTVGFMGFTESYVSEVTCRPYLSVEAIASSRTPLFRKLITTWRFQPASPSSPHPVKTGISPQTLATSPAFNGPTLLSFDLAFAFANPIYATASAAFFKQVSSMMVEAFEKRCLEVYGQGRER